MEFFCYLHIVSCHILICSIIYTTQLRTGSAYFRAKRRSETFLGWSFIRNFGCLNRKLGSDRSGSDQPGSNRSGSNRSGSNRSGSDRSGSDRSGSDRSGSDRSDSDRSGSDGLGSIKSIRVGSISDIRNGVTRTNTTFLDRSGSDRFAVVRNAE